MKALHVVWGLLFDDTRLAVALILALVLGFVARREGAPVLGAVLIWGGLVVALWVSVEHQLKLKVEKLRKS